jgi:hypothetical protein
MLNEELPKDAKVEDQMVVARKLREAIFKSGLISGYPKVQQSMSRLASYSMLRALCRPSIAW